MRLLTVIFFLTAAAACAIAQTPKVIAELSARPDKVVKGAPFSADAVSESLQVLSDGNRISRSWTNKLYRNSEGRFRREGSGRPGSALGAYFSLEPSITILDPVVNNQYYVDLASKTVRTVTLANPVVRIEGGGKISVEVATDAAKIATEIKAARAASAAVVAIDAAPLAIGSSSAIAAPTSAQWDSKTESLGSKNFDGVMADGKRTVTTIPAGAIGNERPIEIVYERWYSQELQVVVYSKHSDPRFGEQTYRLTNISRSEPDPALFELPAGYKIRTVRPAAGYRLVPPATLVEMDRALSPTTPLPPKKP